MEERKILILLRVVSVTLLVVSTTLLMTSCSHNVGMVGIGTGFRAGGGEYGINYNR